jgi:hypothetical protein
MLIAVPIYHESFGPVHSDTWGPAEGGGLVGGLDRHTHSHCKWTKRLLTSMPEPK